MYPLVNLCEYPRDTEAHLLANRMEKDGFYEELLDGLDLSIVPLDDLPRSLLVCTSTTCESYSALILEESSRYVPTKDSDMFDWQSADDLLTLLENVPERLFFDPEFLETLSSEVHVHVTTLQTVRDFVSTYRVIVH